MSLELVPVSRTEAHDFITQWHRHHKPPLGEVFRIGVSDGGELVGVVTVGRPVARAYQDGRTLEVTRCCVSDGARNACSMLYGAAARAAKAIGYTRLITYTQEGESGASMRGAGWDQVAVRPARKGWDTPSRPRENKNDHVARILWEARGMK